MGQLPEPTPGYIDTDKTNNNTPFLVILYTECAFCAQSVRGIISHRMRITFPVCKDTLYRLVK